MSTKKHSDRDKQLDIQVVQSLTQNGIFNQLQSGVLSDVAVAIQSSEFDTMKCYQTIKTDIDSQMSAQIVFEYLKRHNMVNTIRTIQAETNNALSPTPISKDIETNLQISKKVDVLRELIHKYALENADIANYTQTTLNQQINERYANLEKSEAAPQAAPASKPKKAAPSPPPKPAQAPSKPPSASPPRSPATKNKSMQSATTNESSSLDFDFEDVPKHKEFAKSTRTVSPYQKKQDDSSELVFEELVEDYGKPKTTTQPKKASVPKNELSGFDDDSFFDDFSNPSTNTKTQSKNSYGFNDQDEPPVRKAPTKNGNNDTDDNISFSSFDD